MIPLTTALAGAAALVFGTQVLVALWHRARDERHVLALPLAAPPGGWPRLAVLIAARNEAAHVEKAVRTLLALDYPALELVAVDDRSTDATGGILDALAAADPRLKVVHVKSLPPGWLGKTHALAAAAAAATAADWLLMIDADVSLETSTLRRTLADAETHGADHVTVFPHILYDTPGEAMFLAFFGLAFSLQFPLWAVESPRQRAFLGIGAFNLVRRTAFTTIGGYSHLRLAVDDDMRLGEALKAHGFKTRVLFGRDAVMLKWQAGALGYIRGLEKNAFAGLEFSHVRVAAVLAGIALIGWVPCVALAVGPSSARWAAAAAIAATAALLALGKRSTGVPPRYALTAPLAALLLAAAVVFSVARTKRRGGIVWRDTLYPLDELKAHVAARRAWIAAARRAARFPNA